MLGFFSNKSDHPLADLKSAQQLLDGLPKTDAVEVLQEIGHWIEALIDPENEFRLDHQYAVLRLLDDAAHPFLRKIMHGYFAAVPPAAFQEKRMWGAMHVYFTFSELGYLHLLRGLRNGDKGSSAIRQFLPLICARGIYAVSGRLECAAVRYAPIDQQLWGHLAEFYAEAEAQQCQNEMMAVYTGPGGASSIRNLFASLLMWYATGVGSLRPLDLHIAKRLIAHMSKSFAIDKQCAADSLFSFDLARPDAPTRVKEAGTMYPSSMRFVSVGGAPKLFEDMLRTLGKHLVPEELNMGVAYSADLVSEVARRLSGCCNAPLPVRRNTRRKIRVNVNVANGFLKVLEQTSVDLYLDDTPSEAWEVEDISASGFRCVLPAGRASNVKIGALVGMQPEMVMHWGVGIVRRLSRDAQQNLHVGIEMLSSKVQGVVLNDNDGIRHDNQHSALFLGSPDMHNGEGRVLMQADSYSGSRRPTMKIDEKIYLLLPLALVEKGEDFDLTRYRMMQQDASGEEAF
jgi:hypothetical protein